MGQVVCVGDCGSCERAAALLEVQRAAWSAVPSGSRYGGESLKGALKSAGLVLDSAAIEQRRARVRRWSRALTASAVVWLVALVLWVFVAVVAASVALGAVFGAARELPLGLVGVAAAVSLVALACVGVCVAVERRLRRAVADLSVLLETSRLVSLAAAEVDVSALPAALFAQDWLPAYRLPWGEPWPVSRNEQARVLASQSALSVGLLLLLLDSLDGGVAGQPGASRQAGVQV